MIFDLQRFDDEEDSLISGTDGDDLISNGRSNVTINGGTGNDSIFNEPTTLSFDNTQSIFYTVEIYLPDGVSINGGSGKDYIDNQGGDYVTINGDAGNDIIKNTRKTVKYYEAYDYVEEGEEGGQWVSHDFSPDWALINGGEGDDVIHNDGDEVTISGGNGNDTISNEGFDVLFRYASGEGNDVIYGFKEHSTLQIISGTVSKATFKNQDIVLTIGMNNITLKDASEIYTLNLIDKDKIAVKPLFLGTNDNDIMTNDFPNRNIDLIAGNDSITNTSDIVSINAGIGNDSIFNKTTSYDEDGETFLKSPDSVSIDGGAGDDFIHNEGNYAMLVGGDGNDVIENYGDRNNVRRLRSCDDEEGYYDIEEYGMKVSINGGAGNDSIKNDGGEKATISGGTGNDYIFNNSNNVLFKYSAGDGNDKIIGFNATSTLSIGGGSYSSTKSGDNIIVTVGTGKISLMGVASLSKVNIKNTYVPTSLTVTDKTKSLVTVSSDIKTINASSRTKAAKVTGNALANTITGGSGNDSIYGGKGNDSLIGNEGNDLISGGEGNDIIYGKNGNDKLYGNDGADKISGGGGNDSLWGGKGNDTLWGNAGKDIFVYTAGNDVIADYATGDKISLNASISSASVKGADATFKIGSNTLTVKNGKGKKIVFVNSKGKERTIIGGAFLATSGTSKNNTLASWREVGDASERTKAIKIVGNAKNNTILGGSAKDSLYGGKGNDSLNGGDGADFISGGNGNDTIYGKGGNDKLYGNDGADKISGGKGNDTIWGGKGNDSLWGNAGKDTFIYASGDGQDIIYGFDKTDMLKITGTFSATYNKSKKEAYFKVGSTTNAITLKEFGSLTTFNVNGFDYKISGSKLVKQR